MLTQQTLDKLYDMKLTAMAEAFTQQMGKPDLGELSFEDRFAMLVDRQWTFKEDRRMTRLLRIRQAQGQRLHREYRLQDAPRPG
jgi:hypothetical protein